MTLARRFVHAGLWATVANTLITALIVVRSIVLARLLPVEDFGIYAFAAALTTLTAVLARFGMDDALVHKAKESEDEQRAAGTHFTLALLFALVWALLMLTSIFVLANGPTRAALVVLTCTQVALLLSATPTAVLRRRVEHRLLAVVALASTSVSTLVGLALAWQGMGIWSLLLIDAVAAGIGLLALLTWGPSWSPRVRWEPSTISYFLRFGARNVLGRLLEEAVQKIDKLWTGLRLGSEALGLYARSFAYSRAPIGLVDRPLTGVAMGAYAELAEDRPRLTRAMMRTAEVLVHGAALFATVVGLTAPVLIEALIGPKWLPMVEPFRILLVAAVPAAFIRLAVQMLVGVGAPGTRVHIALLRLVTLSIGIGVLGPSLGVNGVAIAVLASSAAGTALALRRVGHYTDLVPRLLLWPPLIAGVLAIVTGVMADSALSPDADPWLRLCVQATAAGSGYALTLALLRGRVFLGHLHFIGSQLRSLASAPRA